MKKIALANITVMATLATAAFAGTIHGKVSGVNGESVVYVEAIAGKTFPAPAQHITIDQKGLTFVPHIVVVQQGATVEFLKATASPITSSGPPSAATRSLGITWAHGPMDSSNPSNSIIPGVVSLLCNVHPEMSAYLIVSPTPYFARPTIPANSKSTMCPTAPTP